MGNFVADPLVEFPSCSTKNDMPASTMLQMFNDALGTPDHAVRSKFF